MARVAIPHTDIIESLLSGRMSMSVLAFVSEKISEIIPNRPPRDEK